ncbi:argininosuccinate lyase [Myxococcota bacterium]|nr:argininosuccinate lyase [Myxococcota bacterium]
MALWDGRFEGGPAEAMLRFSESLGVDLQMFNEDIDGSIAHATMLAEVGLLTAAEAETLRAGLEQVREELRSGAYKPEIALEDVHMAVEARLTAIVGDVGGKLHTARSRNDQVATDVRLWLKNRLGELDQALVELLKALLDRVEQDGRTLMPGYTHLQRGQPIWLGHHLLAYAWMIRRDRQRLHDALDRVDWSPLGACAMAGTPHPIDREMTAELLGFSGPIPNAMDAVAARDHQQEVASFCAILMTHLSRMAEELVLWSGREFNLVRIGEGWTTGSSIMPQKRNPDAAELVRGKAGRVYGDLTALLTMVKGLPLAYNRDLQEDREALFDAVNTTLACVQVCAGMWSSLTVNRERFTAELRGDFLLATELADHLVGQGVPFREAHRVAGQLVKACEARGENLSALTLADLRAVDPRFGDDALSWLEPEGAVERRTSQGGTAWSQVEAQVEALRDELDERDL